MLPESLCKMPGYWIQMLGGQQNNQHTSKAIFYFNLMSLATNLVFVSKNNSKYNHEQRELVNGLLQWGKHNSME